MHLTSYKVWWARTDVAQAIVVPVGSKGVRANCGYVRQHQKCPSSHSARLNDAACVSWTCSRLPARQRRPRPDQPEKIVADL